MVTKSIVSLIVGDEPPPNTARVLFDVPATLSLACDKSPKFVASPADAMVIESIILEVGGVEHEMLESSMGKARLKFKVPLSSLMKSIRKETFDDLLIGNFMKTQIIKGNGLYDPDFTLTVGKYSDNGRVKAEEELKKYFLYYENHRKIQDKLLLKIRKLKTFIISKINKKLIIKIKSIFKR